MMNRLTTIFDLPIEIFTLIVTNDFETFRAAIRTPKIGLLTTHEYCQNIVKSKFIVMYCNKNGDKFWYVNNKIHRKDGPAIEYSDGYKVWYINGKRHRKDGPALEYSNGDKAWYINDHHHREDGPAVEYKTGTKLWYINNKLHREDGPAIEYANGSKEWWINGKRILDKN